MKKVRFSTAESDALLREFQLPVIFVDENGSVTSVNKTAEKILESSRDNYSGMVRKSFRELQKSPTNFIQKNHSVDFCGITGSNGNGKTQIIWVSGQAAGLATGYVAILVSPPNESIAIELRYLHYLESINRLSGRSYRYKKIHTLSRFFASELFKAEYDFFHVGIFLKNPFFYGQEVVLMALAGESRHLFKTNRQFKYRQPVEKGVIGKVLEHRRSLIVDDTDSINFYHSTPFFRGKSEICVPIFLLDEIIGVINIESKSQAHFDSSDQAFLEAVADIYAANIYRIQTNQEIKNQNRKLENYLEQITLTNKRLERKSIELKKALEKGREVQRIVQKQNERIQNKLKMGAELQKSLLPREFPHNDNLTFHARYLPTSQLGGDMYDVFSIDDRHIGIMIADVSGYGVSAAMIAAMFKAYLVNYRKSSLKSADILGHLNREIYSVVQTGDFISAFYMIIDTSTFKAVYSNAGHAFPLLFRKDNAEVEKLDAKGYFVGIFEDQKYQQKETELNPGDRLLFYTDGVTECKNQEEQFGSLRLELLLRDRSAPKTSGKEILDHVLIELKSFSGKTGFDDDVTLLIVERSET